MAQFKNIGIVGLGLIGGSIAIEIKRRKIALSVTGFSRRVATLKKAKEDGLIDGYFENFEEGLGNLDFLILATPVEAVKDYLARISREKSPVLVTDVASVKEKIVKEASDILGPGNNFVASHPMAGSEKSGLTAARENLFEQKVVIITPGEGTKKENIEKVRGFWESLGAKTFFLAPSEHDRLIALTSHVPHLIVYSLIALLKEGGNQKILLNLLGTGFLDTTRIGKSSPGLWAEIFFANKGNICLWLDAFEKILEEMKESLRSDSREKLETRLNELKSLREKADETERVI